MTDRVLYIQAKKITGTTNVSIYDENMRLIKVVDVEVAFDTGNLQSRKFELSRVTQGYAPAMTTGKSY